MPLDPNAWNLLAQGVSSWRDRRDRDKDQKYDRERQARLDQIELENNQLRRQLVQQQLEASKFNLGEQKKTATAQDAVINFDPTKFMELGPMPEVGPPAPGRSADISRPFHAQAPEIRGQVIQDLVRNGVGAADAARLFNQIVQANTGAPIVPQAPAGMQPSEFVVDGFKFEPKVEVPAGARPSSARVGNTTYEYPAPAVPAQIQPVLDTAGNPMPGLYTGPDGKAHPLPRSAAPTEAQSNAKIYAERMKFNEEALRRLQKDYDPTSLRRLPQESPLYGGLGDGMLRYLRSGEGNQYIDAKKNWIAAALRKESGAAISQAEYANADKQYFPQLGDGPAEIEQKRKLRELVATEMEKIGTPPQVELPFGGNPPPQPPPQPAPNPNAATPNAPVPVNSQAEYDALPPGAWYLDSTGVPKQKRR